MKRIQEKVKDIVEVRPYESLQDFISNPAQTLAIYHFTDLTADLMAKWLEVVAGVQPGRGASNALAGYRGVGKSHFLATLGAIVSHPELRTKVSDPHVAAVAQQLKRRRHQVSFVKRGLHETLLEEIKDAIALTFEVGVETLSDSLQDLLEFGVRRSGDMPFVLLIDTAFERTSRVLRDDGVMLGEIAEIAADMNVFVGVALDDDIAGADGVNAAIVRNFKIDYLDHEHLYRIVDTNIFPKQRQTAPILHDIYAYFRGVMPNFRWSEQKFASLYPLHPTILEIAPFVRLYVPAFALLGFASEAGRKILGRPANSLIGLDEVFDSVENNLRKVEDLKEAFAVYDKLNSEVVSHIPIMQRLQAKLILKALLLLSLDGDGTTAGEISAAMLIFDENDPNKARQIVEELVETFVSVFPEDIKRISEEGRETRYGFKVQSKENLNRALTEASQSISPDIIPKILLRITRDKYADWTISEDREGGENYSMFTQIVWRGGQRRGVVIWDLENNPKNRESLENSALAEWELIISPEGKNIQSSAEKEDIPKIFWQPEALRKDEIETILRYSVLLTQTDLAEQFGDQIRAAGHAHTIAVEKIWNRVFLQEGKLTIDGFDYNFTEEARRSKNISEMLTAMLEPVFEMRFPAHPFFGRTLGMPEVSTLVNDLFSGARQNLEEVQRLAEIFALPLGLVTLRSGLYVLESEENLQNSPFVQQILELLKSGGDETVSLEKVYKQLRKAPSGLVREAQHLILAALVAQRQIEFVTTKGDRINRRSLDLKIIWTDIEGIAKPTSVVYSSERLTTWAKILTGAEAFYSIENPEDREAARNALRGWLADWEAARVLERFAGLSDEILNTKIWRLAMLAEKTFGSVAETVRFVLEESISIDEGLHRIADAFSDSEEEFFNRTRDLVIMEDFISGAAKRSEIWTYLAVCETTEDEKIEYLRARLLQIIEESATSPSETLNKEMEDLWKAFKDRFSEFFSANHDLVMKSHVLQEKYAEILRSDEWWEFENLSKLPIFQQNHIKEAQKLCAQLKQLDCRYEVREMLKTHPFCACSFNLAQIKNWEMLPQKLWETINRGRFSYKRNLLLLKDTILPLVDQFSAQTNDMEFLNAAVNLTETLKSGKEVQFFSNHELIILQQIFEILPASPLLHLKMPSAKDFMSKEELRGKFNQWLDELPGEPVLLKI
jgi:hypothetical protein